jgi:hypothetical protein
VTRVRILAEHRSSSINPYQERTFMPGEELELVWIGNSWWTGHDVDAAHIVPADKVELVNTQSQVPDIGIAP